MKKVTYPFVPKSTAYLVPGQFWSIPLENGSFACGHVVQMSFHNGAKDTRWFLAGLLDWVEKQAPSSLAIAGCGVIEQGYAHIGNIRHCGGEVVGFRALEEDEINPQMFCSQIAFARTCMLMSGLNELRPATREEHERYPTLPFWGTGYIKFLAERHCGT